MNIIKLEESRGYALNRVNTIYRWHLLR